MGIIFLLVVNFAISWWNAYAVGKAWFPAKNASPGFKLLIWSAAVMSAIGFSYVFMFVIGFFGIQWDIATHSDPGEQLWFTQTMIEGYFSLGYILIWPPIVASGLVITIHSWKVAREHGGTGNYLVAGWNTYAQFSNIVNGVRYLPEAFHNVWKMAAGMLKGDDIRVKAGLAAIFGIVASLFLGGLLTRAIVLNTARKTMQDARIRYDDRINEAYDRPDPREQRRASARW